MKQQSFIRHTVERTAAITSGTFTGILGSCAEHSPRVQFIGYGIRDTNIAFKTCQVKNHNAGSTGSLHIQMSNHKGIKNYPTLETGITHICFDDLPGDAYQLGSLKVAEGNHK